MLWIRIGFNADPDPAFVEYETGSSIFFNADPDPETFYGRFFYIFFLIFLVKN
jgi:hypothetical protein